MSTTERVNVDSSGSHSGLQDWSQWPVYESSALGLRNYWFPALWSRQLPEDRPVGVKLLGENIMLSRDGGKVYGLYDRCPHRGVKLSDGTKEFPGTVSCVYHGWTFNLDDGVMCAAITDGPDSPIAGRVGVRTYPVVERIGLIWVFVGDKEPHPIEDQLPAELVNNDFVAAGRITPHRYGSWRLAAENGFDEGHARYLHRNTPWLLFRQMPTWQRTRIEPSDDRKWIFRVQDFAEFESHFPGLGKWPAKRKITHLSKRGTKPSDAKRTDPVILAMDLPGNMSIRLPGLLRVAWTGWMHFEWYVPEDENHHRYVQFAVKFNTGLKGWLFKLRYWTYIRWLFHGQFTGQDTWMVEEMDAPPEKLYRPDISIIEWRRLVETSLAPAADGSGD